MARRRSRRSVEEQIAVQVVTEMMRSRQGRRVLIVALICGAIVIGAVWLWQNHLRPRHPVGPTVRIATWNLRQFSDRQRVDLRMIADVIRSSNFDIVAIQEVKREGEEVDRLLNVLGVPWRSARLSPMTGNHERFAFIYNGDHVQEVAGASAQFIASADAGVFDRTPYQQSFRAGNFDFTLVTCHLSYTDTMRRRREAEALARIAKDLAAHAAEKDVIVLGDFNEEHVGGNLHYFLEEGWESVNHDPTNLSGSETYDSLLIDPTNTREWSGVAGSIHFDETRYGNDDKQALNAVSDHRPAYADFVTNLPDDD
jgi:hypothetical protein